MLTKILRVLPFFKGINCNKVLFCICFVNILETLLDLCQTQIINTALDYEHSRFCLFLYLHFVSSTEKYSIDKLWHWSQSSLTNCKMRENSLHSFSHVCTATFVPDLFISFPSLPEMTHTAPGHLLQLAKKPFWYVYKYWEWLLAPTTWPFKINLIKTEKQQALEGKMQRALFKSEICRFTGDEHCSKTV